ncbi:proteasomal ubiquitin receptor ADRM1-like [Tubulanus polymorphus]|uniref:proteasomal ubiquitin receptor ADRM1-like n=1 Tax=Tubulanus polymorphus TaxID=672921 RepID=UPI003DA338D9
MATGALFGGATGARSQSQNLVEFRAGKMFMRGKMVHPDKRKGMVYVYQSDDSLMHFCWKDRTSGVVEDDLIIFPDDIEYKHVTQCTTGRVYILKFKSSSRKFFFWMQEPKTDKDDEYRRQVNDFLNNPPAPGSNRGSSGAGGLGGSLPPELAGLAGDGDINNLLSNMNQQQLMQLLSGMGMGGAGGGAGGLGGLSSLISGRPSSAQSTDSNTTPSRAQSSPGGARTNTLNVSDLSRPATTAATPTAASGTGATSSSSNSATPSRQQIQLSDLQNILSNMTVPSTPSSEPIDLSKALGHETLIPLLANPEVQERLIPFLPEGETLPKTAEELRATVLSPQFQQAVTTFSSALASGQLGPLISNFGLGDEAAACATAGDVEGFVKAVQEYEAKQNKNSEEKMDDN